jgi:hypothetical protein
MRVRNVLCGASIAVALLSSPAAAAQIVSLDLSPADPDGVFFASGAFDWPGEGQTATARLEFNGVQLLDATLTGSGLSAATWWDSDLGEITGNEYLFAFDCTFSGGCVSQPAPGLALARLETPFGFDVPCTAATVRVVSRDVV